MAIVEVADSKGPGNSVPGAHDTDTKTGSSDKARSDKPGKYRIAIVLGVIAVSFYVLSIVSIMFSRGIGG